MSHTLYAQDRGAGSGGGGKGGNGTVHIAEILRADYVFDHQDCPVFETTESKWVCGVLSDAINRTTFDQYLYYIHCCPR